jgi:hypothetical protein
MACVSSILTIQNCGQPPKKKVASIEMSTKSFKSIIQRAEMLYFLHQRFLSQVSRAADIAVSIINDAKVVAGITQTTKNYLGMAKG